MNQTTAAPPPPTLKQALILWPIVIVLLVAYIVITAALHIQTPYAGFFFVLYWATFRHSAPEAFLPGLLGALAGIGTGYLLYLATPMGLNALLGAAALIFVAILIDMLRWFPLVINASYMLFLTVAGAGPMQREGDFRGQTAALVISAAFFGAIIFGAGWLQARKQRAVTIH